MALSPLNVATELISGLLALEECGPGVAFTWHRDSPDVRVKVLAMRPPEEYCTYVFIEEMLKPKPGKKRQQAWVKFTPDAAAKCSIKDVLNLRRWTFSYNKQYVVSEFEVHSIAPVTTETVRISDSSIFDNPILSPLAAADAITSEISTQEFEELPSLPKSDGDAEMGDGVSVPPLTDDMVDSKVSAPDCDVTMDAVSTIPPPPNEVHYVEIEGKTVILYNGKHYDRPEAHALAADDYTWNFIVREWKLAIRGSDGVVHKYKTLNSLMETPRECVGVMVIRGLYVGAKHATAKQNMVRGIGTRDPYLQCEMIAYEIFSGLTYGFYARRELFEEILNHTTKEWMKLSDDAKGAVYDVVRSKDFVVKVQAFDHTSAYQRDFGWRQPKTVAFRVHKIRHKIIKILNVLDREKYQIAWGPLEKDWE